MAFLFDTDAISEILRQRPARRYVRWLESLPREQQFTSAVVIAELYRGAFRSPRRDLHLKNIDERVLPAVTVLPFDHLVARTYGKICAHLEFKGEALADADLQIAATAIQFDLELVTGNIRHFKRVPGLRTNPILARTRTQ